MKKDTPADTMAATPDAAMQEQTQSVQRDGRPDVLTGMYFRALLRRTVATERHPGPLEVRLDQDNEPLETPIDDTPSQVTGVGRREKVASTVSTRGQITWV
jgi:hypothetical protein